jgi:hypothetical protein
MINFHKCLSFKKSAEKISADFHFYTIGNCSKSTLPFVLFGYIKICDRQATSGER